MGNVSPTPTFAGCSLLTSSLNNHDACLNIDPRIFLKKALKNNLFSQYVATEF